MLIVGIVGFCLGVVGLGSCILAWVALDNIRIRNFLVELNKHVQRQDSRKKWIEYFKQKMATERDPRVRDQAYHDWTKLERTQFLSGEWFRKQSWH